MKVTSTLSLYIARSYALNLIAMLIVLLSIVYLFDTIELLRRAGSQDNVSLATILQMGLLKLPEVGQLIFPFAVLFSAMFTFWRLTRRLELVVVRSAGFSAWQFLTPVIGVGILFAVLNLFILNPLGAACLSKFERMENNLLSNQKSYITLLREGLWLRQFQFNDNNDVNGHIILHASKIKLPEWQLENVIALYFDNRDQFIRRIDAPRATLEDGAWMFQSAIKNRLGDDPQIIPTIALKTDLTRENLEEQFSSPETISFWALPQFIDTMEKTGFDATSLKIHYHSLLAQPLLFAAMIILAASVSLRMQRMRGGFLLIAIGVGLGFVVFFLESFLKTLGASGQIPFVMAAWTPSIITILLAIATIISFEDG